MRRLVFVGGCAGNLERCSENIPLGVDINALIEQKLYNGLYKQKQLLFFLGYAVLVVACGLQEGPVLTALGINVSATF